MNQPSPAVIANEIRMMRSQYSGTFLLVEGREDRLFMERFLHLEYCKIRVVEGKQNVYDVIQILDQDKFSGALGMVDADFDRVIGNPRPSNNIIMPEGHDLESMIMSSPALGRVLNEFASETKLQMLDSDTLGELLKSALPISYLRLHSLMKKLDLKFKKLKYGRWIDKATLKSCKHSLIETVKNHSQRPDLSSEELAAAMEGIEGAKFCAREMCVGTDLIEILSLGLKKAIGSNSQSLLVSGDNLRRCLRLAYSDDEFRSSRLCEEIRKWEEQGHGFRVLPVGLQFRN